MLLFPNPAHHYISIQGLKIPSEIHIVSSDGGKLFSKVIIPYGRLDLNLSSGLYFLNIMMGDTSSVHKIIIK